MSNRWFTVIVILLMMAGGLYAVFTWNSTPPPVPALSEAEQAVMSAQQALAVAEQASRDALAVRQSLAKEVRARNEAIHKEVADYDAARIARELNIFCSGER